METVLEEIRKLSMSVQSIKDDIKQLSDKFDAHLTTCPTSGTQYQIPVDGGEIRMSHIQGQGQSSQCHNHTNNDVHHQGEGHSDANHVGINCLENPECDQGHDRVQGHCKGQDEVDAVHECITQTQHKGQYLSPLPQHPGNHGDEETQAKEVDETTSNDRPETVQLRHLTVPHTYERRSVVRRSIRERQRQCLRLAIQQNTLLLLDILPFVRGDFLDQLIEENCLTDNECTEFNDTRNGSGKDKVRNMMRIIRGRSYEVMDRFLKCLENVVPDVVEIIRKTYDKCLKDNHITPVCTFCLLKQSVDVKTVGDVTWSVRKITDSLYDEIIIGKIDTQILWNKFATECNTSKDVKSVIMTISKYLQLKGQYRELVKRLSRVNTLICQCFCKPTEQNKSTRPLVRIDSETESEGYTPDSSRRSSLNSLTPEIDDDTQNVLSWQKFVSLYTDFAQSVNRQSSDITELRSRSNSFGKSHYTTPRGIDNLRNPLNRRASMFV